MKNETEGRAQQNAIRYKNSSTIALDSPSFTFTIIDRRIPLVILFGPRHCGKTMTWIRLTRHLESLGFCVAPDCFLRPSHDLYYTKQCENFKELCYSHDAPYGIEFMLLKVSDKTGHPICQLLELPGDFCFDPIYLQSNTIESPVLTQIMNLPNPRTWIFMLELNMWNAATRSIYAEKIDHIPHRMQSDKVIFTCNKIDKYPELFDNTESPNVTAIFRELQAQYPGVFSFFENQNPFTRFFCKYSCSLIPFSAGIFSITDSGRQYYIPGNDMYPQQLWKAIMKSVRR